MDALSTLLEEIHLKDARYHYIHGHGDWQFLLTPPKYLMVFYVVLSGSFNIQIVDDTIVANAGDMLMLPRSDKHLCYATSNMDVKPQSNASFELLEKLPRNQDQPIQIGNGFINTQAILILCEYDQDMAKPLLNALPTILPEPKTQSTEQAPVNNMLQQGFGGFSFGGSNNFDIHTEILKIGLAYLSLETRANRMGKATMINRLISMLMVECLREYIESLDKDADNWLLALTDANLAKAIGVMHANPEKNWSINSLADVAGMSRSSFAERFKIVVGEPPLAYLTSYRMRLSARFLRLEQYSIGRISDLVGYASDSTFSQAFKRAYGVSPMQYRQQYIQENH